MKTQAEIESLVASLDRKLAELPAQLDRESRRELYLAEAERILQCFESIERWPIFCQLDVVGIRHGVANYLD